MLMSHDSQPSTETVCVCVRVRVCSGGCDVEELV